jgi:hypothetical protein
MIILKETTDWSEATCRVYNHYYLVSDNKQTVYAYYNVKQKQLIPLPNPMPFHTSYRKFKKVCQIELDSNRSKTTAVY